MAAAAAVAALVWVNLPGSDSENTGPAGQFPPPEGGPITDTFAVPTFDWDEGGGDDAIVSWALAFTDAGCTMPGVRQERDAVVPPERDRGHLRQRGARGGRRAGLRLRDRGGDDGVCRRLEGADDRQVRAGLGGAVRRHPARDSVYVNDVAAHQPLTASPEPPGELPTVPTTCEEAGWFDVPTYTFDPEAPREDAPVEGVVQFTNDGCPYVETDGVRTGLVLPNAEGFDNPQAEEPLMVYAYFGTAPPA